jgi:hypothetical protein
MGAFYRATETQFNRDVAIQVFSDAFGVPIRPQRWKGDRGLREDFRPLVQSVRS